MYAINRGVVFVYQPQKIYWVPTVSMDIFTLTCNSAGSPAGTVQKTRSSTLLSARLWPQMIPKFKMRSSWIQALIDIIHEIWQDILEFRGRMSAQALLELPLPNVRRGTSIPVYVLYYWNEANKSRFRIITVSYAAQRLAYLGPFINVT